MDKRNECKNLFGIDDHQLNKCLSAIKLHFLNNIVLQDDDILNSIIEYKREIIKKWKPELTSSSSDIGSRPYNEDTIVSTSVYRTDNMPIHIYGVFDGHGGSMVSKYLSQNIANYFVNTKTTLNQKIIKNIFRKIDDDLRKMNVGEAGSTAIMLFMEGDNVFLVNLGDSRGILIDSNKTILLETKDHKPNDPEEIKRIEAAGGKILFYGTFRIDGILAVSRAFGDFYLKEKEPYKVSIEPDIYHYRIKENQGSIYAVLASDGVWDVIKSQEATMTADEIVKKAIARGSKDNTTCITLRLH